MGGRPGVPASMRMMGMNGLSLACCRCISTAHKAINTRGNTDGVPLRLSCTTGTCSTPASTRRIGEACINRFAPMLNFYLSGSKSLDMDAYITSECVHLCRQSTMRKANTAVGRGSLVATRISGCTLKLLRKVSPSARKSASFGPQDSTSLLQS